MTPTRELLEVLAGPFRAYAIYAAAELGVADRLADGAATAAELAEQLGADPDALHRLLRLLARLGVVAQNDGHGYGLTPRGELLRSGPGSMRDVAILYGRQFYRPLAELPHSIRTGEAGFPRVFGASWLDYLAGQPEAARVFDSAMEASSEFFVALLAAYDFTRVRTVVDVGGGNGALLGAVLEAHPHVEGVILELPHVVEATRARLRHKGFADRCRVVGGDFFASVPGGGDAYMLSRVLHDWEDEDCVALLRACREAMGAGSELLILERIVPDDGEPSLALEWDIHMLANTGGRERTKAEYQALLARTGFEPRDVRPLALDVSVLVAGPR